jgi:hypothetical protein
MEISVGTSFSPFSDSQTRAGVRAQFYDGLNAAAQGFGPDPARADGQDREGQEGREIGAQGFQGSRQAFGARAADGRAAGAKEAGGAKDAAGNAKEAPQAAGSAREDSLELSDDAKRMVDELKARDRAVRAHEAAHLAAGAGIVKGGAQFTTQRGPDGNMYAVGGEVAIDASEVPNDPRATMAKARQIAAAALAPSDPSPTDRAAAAGARQMESKAALELAAKLSEEGKPGRVEEAKTGRQDEARGAAPQGRPDISRQAADAYGDQQARNIIGSLFQAVA